MSSGSGDDDDHVLSDTALVSTKQTQFPRVWSKEDEITILRGLSAYRDTHGGGVVPSALSHMDGFLPFIRPSLQIKEEVKNTQLIDKIRHLRQKYRAVRLRGMGRRLSFTNPHDETLYHLSSNLWEDGRSASATATAGDKRKKLRKRAEVEDNGHVEDVQAALSDTTAPDPQHHHSSSDNDSSSSDTSSGEGETEEEDNGTNPSVHTHSSRHGHSSRIVSTKRPAEEKQQQSIIQRVWSEEDEIAILRGLADYCAETGTVPSGLSHMDAFLAFIRKSLQIKEEVKKTQLNNKVRHLREKYQALRRRGRGGRRLFFIKPHDEMLYHLSSKVWGAAEDGSASDASANGNASAVAKKKLRKRDEENGDAPHDNNDNAAEKKKKHKRRTKTKETEVEVEENVEASAGEKKKKKRKKQKNTMEEEEGAPSNEDSARVVKGKVSYPFLMDAITRTGMMTNSDAVKRGLELADPSKAQVLEERCKRLRLLETKNHLRRASLIKETVKLSLKSLENEG